MCIWRLNFKNVIFNIMHGNLLMRCDTCPNWCDRRNEEIGGQRKDFWCEEMKRIYLKIGLKISCGVIRDLRECLGII